ncbi:hypothetical protein CLU79DRAFT_758777 [Phycomyces nitens]|nr:hypothetical protein CLU79DRAFT_758777 [Phycomyces nitens]
MDITSEDERRLFGGFDASDEEQEVQNVTKSQKAKHPANPSAMDVKRSLPDINDSVTHILSSLEADQTATDKLVGLATGSAAGPATTDITIDNTVSTSYQKDIKTSNAAESSAKYKDSLTKDEDEYDEDSEEEEEEYEDEDDDDDDIDIDDDVDADVDVEWIQDYMENMELQGESLEDLGKFVKQFDLDKEPKLVDRWLDEDVIDIQKMSAPPKNRKERRRHLQNDGFIEMTDKEFRLSLEDALDEFPSSLRKGVKARISAGELMENEDKKAKKKQKSLERRLRKVEKKLSKETVAKIDMRKIDRRLCDFINDDSISSFQFSPMSNNERRQVHMLARAYNLKSTSLGSGENRSPTVTKTDRTFMPADRRYIERFISQAQQTVDATNALSIKQQAAIAKQKIFGPPTLSKKEKNKPKKKEKEKENRKEVQAKVVAADAAPISDANVGHRMLSAMGWSQGDSLGTTNTGIINPIEAIMRPKGKGLGTG